MSGPSLPPGWRLRPLGELAKFINGDRGANYPSKGDFVARGVPFINAGHLRDGCIDFSSMNFISDERFALLRGGHVQPGDVLYCLRGSLGKSAIVSNVERGAVASSLVVIRPTLESDGRYIYYYLVSPLGREMIAAYDNGSAQPNLSVKSVQKFSVPVAPPNQQHQIVEKIEALTAKSRRAKEALDAIPPLLERFRQSVLAAAFRGDLTKDWREQNPDVEPADQLLARIRRERRARWEQADRERLRAKGTVPKNDEWKKKYVEPERVSDEGLPGLPDGWRWAGFGELCDSIEGGTTVPPIAQITDYPVLRSSSVRVGTIDFDDVRWLPARVAEAESKKVRDGDLLFTRLSGSIEYVANCACVRGLGDSWLAYPDRLFCARLVDNRLAEFVELAFSMPFIHRAITAHAKSTAGHQRISISNLSAQPLPVPPLVEQHAMVERVRAQLGFAARVHDAVRAAAVRLDPLQQSVLAQAFRGALL